MHWFLHLNPWPLESSNPSATRYKKSMIVTERNDGDGRYIEDERK